MRVAIEQCTKALEHKEYFLRRRRSPALCQCLSWKQLIKISATSKRLEILTAWSCASLLTKLSFGNECSSNKQYFTHDRLASPGYFYCFIFSCKKEGLHASLFVRSMFGSNHSTHWDAIPLNLWQLIFSSLFKIHLAAISVTSSYSNTCLFILNVLLVNKTYSS